MHESTLVQYLTEKATAEALQEGRQEGRQEGIKTRAIEDILEALEIRLNPNIAHDFKSELESIDDLEHLRRLHRAAILADTSEDFQQVLQGSNN